MHQLRKHVELWPELEARKPLQSLRTSQGSVALQKVLPTLSNFSSHILAQEAPAVVQELEEPVDTVACEA